MFRRPWSIVLHSGPALDTQCYRACDRCRRKKIKVSLISRTYKRLAKRYEQCDSVDSSCTGCRRADQPCTFEIPTGKRGPKGKALRQTTVDDSIQCSSPGDTIIVSPPLTSFDSPLAHVDEPYGNSPPFYSPFQYHLTLAQRWDDLSRAVILASSTPTTLEAVIRECVDLFFHYLGPSAICVHEPSFRHSLDQALSASPPGSCLTESDFTLITAVCAKVCFFVPSNTHRDFIVLLDTLSRIDSRASDALRRELT